MKKQSIFTLVALAGAFAVQAQSVNLKTSSTEQVIHAMTLEEKVTIINGTNQHPMNGKLGVGATYALPNLGISNAVLDDGPAGLRIPAKRQGDAKTYYCTAFPTATALAASWNAPLVKEVGAAMGNEVLEYGSDVLLAPAINIHRDPLNGRNFEYFSEDPLLTGRMAIAIVSGVQSQGVGTSVKHFAANNQETNRKTINAVISQRALREIYLRGFELVVREADPWTLMASYNKINGLNTVQNKELLDNLLRQEWGYKGLVMTDWTNGDDAVAQMRAGISLIMPGLTKDQLRYYYDDILNGVKDRTLDESVLDRNIKYILELVKRTPRYRDYSFSSTPDLKAHAATSQRAAEECMVLLKNESQTLPFDKKIKTIALYGKTSYDFIAGGRGSGEVNYEKSISLLEGLSGAGYKSDEALASFYRNAVDSIFKTSKADARSKKYAVAYAKEILPSASMLASEVKKSDVAIITLGRVSTEGSDSAEKGYFTLSDLEQKLVGAVCTAYHADGKKVIVILNIGSVIETESWKAKPDAILVSWQAGQQGGSAVANILTGKTNPSGKLPDSWPKAYKDCPSSNSFPGWPQDNPINSFYNEGIYVGYRYFTTFKVPVSYPFGYGLSYTTFDYSNLKLSSTSFGEKITATVEIKNTGKVAGREAVQLYIAAPTGKDMVDKPVRELRAFAKSDLLAPGQSQTLSFEIDGRALSSFYSGVSAWVADQGEYTVQIGASSEDIRQSAKFTLSERRIVEKTQDILYPNLAIKDLGTQSDKVLGDKVPFDSFKNKQSFLWRRQGIK